MSFPKGKSMLNAKLTIGSASADKVMSKLRNTLSLPTVKIERFPLEAEKSFLSQPIVVNIPERRLYKNVSIIDEDATIALLANAVSVLPVGKVTYIDNIPTNELADITITVLFVSAVEDQQTIDNLSNALTIATNIKANSSTGKIDYSKLDAEMIASLPANKKLSDYIKNVRKYPIKKILGVTTRSTTKVGGEYNV